jgi:transcriptional regulator with XRE-family HTH domain
MAPCRYGIAWCSYCSPRMKMGFLTISNNFVEALRRTMRAGNMDENGHLAAMTQHQLSIESDVGRSTIAKYLSGNQRDPANPTLEVLCRLATTLGVPPAFLLMSGDDWVRICHAIDYLNRLEKDSRYNKFATQITDAGNKFNNVDIAEAGLSLAQMLGLLPRDNCSDFWSVKKRKTAIAATCLAPPLSSMSSRFRPSILTLCSIVGASLPRA